jgi:hypothetical protein
MVIYVAFRFLYEQRGPLSRFLTFALKTVGLAALGLGISAASLLPQVWVLTNSERTVDVTSRLSLASLFGLRGAAFYVSSFLRFFSNDLTGTGTTGRDYFGNWNYYETPVLYCGLIALLLIPYLLGRLNKQKMILIGAVLLIGVLSIIFPISNRIHFVLINFELLLTAWALDALLESKTRQAALFVVTALGMLLLVGILLLVGVAYLNWTPSEIRIALLRYALIAGWLVAYTVLLPLFSSPRAIFAKKLLLVLLVAGEAVTFAHRAVNKRNTLTKMDIVALKAKKRSMSKAMRFLEKRDRGFFRVEDHTEGTYLNDSLIYGYRGVKSYNSLINPSSFSIMKYLSTEPFNKRMLFGFGEAIELADLLSVKYALMTNPWAVPKGSKYLAGFGKVHLVENSSALPFALTYDRYIPLKRFLTLPKEKRWDLLSRAVVLPETVENPGVPLLSRKELEVKTPPWRQVRVDLEADGGVNVKAVDFPKKLTLARTRIGASFYLLVDNGRRENLERRLVLETWTRAAKPFYMAVHWSYRGKPIHRSRRIGYFRVLGGRQKHRIFLGPVGSVQYLNVSIAGAGPNVTFEHISLQQRVSATTGRTREAMKRPRVVVDRVESDRISGRASLPAGKIVTFGIPFHPGWRLNVDREEVDLFEANVGLTGARLKAGHHKFELLYCSPCVGVGLALSLASILGSLLMLIGVRKGLLWPRPRRPQA